MAGKRSYHNAGQVVFEVALVIAIVALALGMMQIYIRRGIQAGIKIAADEIGLQQDSENIEREDGYLSESYVLKEESSENTPMHLAGGRHSLTVIETSEAIYGGSQSWSNFREDLDD